MRTHSFDLHPELKKRILFIGGPAIRASVRVRCIEISQFIGCDFVTNVNSISMIPNHKTIFICIKPDLSEDHLQYLSAKGTIIWDIHDDVPPRNFITAYIASTENAADIFHGLGQIYVIPHHHCNLTGKPNSSPKVRQPSWIGRPYWCPDFKHLEYDFYDSNKMSHSEVVSAYRNTGISLNLRAIKKDSGFHISINPGVKLLNAIGFGIPSISNREPAYLDFGDGCTVFADLKESNDWIDRLKKDDTLYRQLRQSCLKRAPDFHITQVAMKYINMLHTITQ